MTESETYFNGDADRWTPEEREEYERWLDSLDATGTAELRIEAAA